MFICTLKLKSFHILSLSCCSNNLLAELLSLTYRSETAFCSYIWSLFNQGALHPSCLNSFFFSLRGGSVGNCIKNSSRSFHCCVVMRKSQHPFSGFNKRSESDLFKFEGYSNYTLWYLYSDLLSFREVKRKGELKQREYFMSSGRCHLQFCNLVLCSLKLAHIISQISAVITWEDLHLRDRKSVV